MKSSLHAIVASCIIAPLLTVSCSSNYVNPTNTSYTITQTAQAKTSEKQTYKLSEKEAYKEKYGLYQETPGMEPWEQYKPKCVGMICGPLDWEGIKSLSPEQREKLDAHIKDYFIKQEKYYKKKLGDKQTISDSPFKYSIDGV